jgi:hypothetical protein
VRDTGRSTGQTFASAEHVDEGVVVVVVCGEFFCDESTQPAVKRSRERVIRIQAYITFLNNGFVNFRIVNPPQCYPKYQDIFIYDCLVVLVLLFLYKEFVAIRQLRVITNSNFHSFETTKIKLHFKTGDTIEKMKKNYFQKLKSTRYCCVQSPSRTVS